MTPQIETMNGVPMSISPTEKSAKEMIERMLVGKTLDERRATLAVLESAIGDFEANIDKQQQEIRYNQRNEEWRLIIKGNRASWQRWAEGVIIESYRQTSIEDAVIDAALIVRDYQPARSLQRLDIPVPRISPEQLKSR